jgi:hypothetical protein
VVGGDGLWWLVAGGVGQPITMSLPTRVEAELGCDNISTHCKIKLIEDDYFCIDSNSVSIYSIMLVFISVKPASEFSLR